MVRRLARLLRDRCGQDLVEYALLAGFLATAAGAGLPGISSYISVIFSKVNLTLATAVACLGAPGNTGSNGCGPLTPPPGQ